MIIRQAREADVRAISAIVVEDWQNAYRGIIADDYLDSLSVESQYQRDIRRYWEYTVADDQGEILGYAWNRPLDNEDADCEIVALYVKFSGRNNGTGKALLQNAMDTFRKAGKKRMIIWCLQDNAAARQFYEKTGGQVYKTDTHTWGGREYALISYRYPL